MRPPIASPHEKEGPVAPVTRRVEWDFERECLVLRYRSPYKSRMRCELYTGMRNFWGFLGVTLGLPLTAAIVVLSTAAQNSKRPCEFRVFAWGIEDASVEMTFKVPWKRVKRLVIHQGDLFVWRRASFVPAHYLCRECFCDEAEALRLQQAIELLKEQNGANWETVKQQFQSS